MAEQSTLRASVAYWKSDAGEAASARETRPAAAVRVPPCVALREPQRDGAGEAVADEDGEVATGRHVVAIADRREQARKQKQDIPARRLPAVYRCTKVATEVKTADAVEFACSVSDYTLETSSATADDGGRARADKGQAAALLGRH